MWWRFQTCYFEVKYILSDINTSSTTNSLSYGMSLNRNLIFVYESGEVHWHDLAIKNNV